MSTEADLAMIEERWETAVSEWNLDTSYDQSRDLVDIGYELLALAREALKGREDRYWRWVVEYVPDWRMSEEPIAHRTQQAAQDACDNLNENHSPTGRDYRVVKFRRIKGAARNAAGGK